MIKIKKYLKRILLSVLIVTVLFHTALLLIAVAGSLYLKNHIPNVYSMKKIRNNLEIKSKQGFLDEVPQAMQDVLIFVEDTRFYEHNGMDLRAINNALDINKAMGFRAYGGSTITQQLARTLFLSPEKNYLRKYVEIIIALTMDSILSKERILELYFNCVEWGPGIYGAFDAANANYEKKLSDLSIKEQLELITILPNPRVFTIRNFREDELMTARYDSLVQFLLRKSRSLFDSTFREK